MDLTRADIENWLRSAWEFSQARLPESLLVVVAFALFYLVARSFLALVQNRLTSRTETEVDDCIVTLMRRALLVSVAFAGLWVLAHIWTLRSLEGWFLALWLLVLSFPVSRFVGEVLRIFEHKVVSRTETKLDDTVLPLANRVVQFLVIAVGILTALSVLGWEITPLLGVGGIAGLAISFAAKDTLSNLIAGFLLILDRPFQVGDRIELWGAPPNTASWGDVIEIGLRATKIKTPDNLIVIIPNAEMMIRDIINYTASGEHIRLRVPIGIGYGADVEKAKAVVLQVADGIEGVMKNPPPVVIVRRFGESSVDLEARVWVQRARQRRDIEDRLTERVKMAFDREGIEIPFPKRDIYVRHVSEESRKKDGPEEGSRQDKPPTADG